MQITTIPQLLTELNQKLSNRLQLGRDEMQGIRTGRATPALLEGIKANVYGGTILTIKELGSITNDGPMSLLVTPFDVSTIIDIEKAIVNSPIGASPKTEGKSIRVNIPPLTAEQREKFAKFVTVKIEEVKAMIRHDRDEVRKRVKAMQDEKSISEDERFRAEKDIDEKIKKATEDLEEIKRKKHDEISQI